MRFLNRNEVKKKLRENLILKSGFCNTMGTRRLKGKALDVIEKTNQWILKHQDELFQDELRKIKIDFPEKCCDKFFIYEKQKEYIKFLKDKADKKIKDNHSRITTKHRELLNTVVKSDNGIGD